MSTVGIYAGSYDPFTYGHLSVVRGALQVFDKVVIAIGINPTKGGLFSAIERRELIEDTLKAGSPVGIDFARIQIERFQGLLINYAQTIPDSVLVRGLRAVSDFEQEMAIADANRKQAPIQTIFIPAEAQHAFVSSSTVKELALYPDSDISAYVTDYVGEQLRAALKV